MPGPARGNGSLRSALLLSAERIRLANSGQAPAWWIMLGLAATRSPLDCTGTGVVATKNKEQGKWDQNKTSRIEEDVLQAHRCEQYHPALIQSFHRRTKRPYDDD